MFEKLLIWLGLKDMGDARLYKKVDTRRTAIRHPGVHAEVLVGDRVYSMRDWSMGGVSFDSTAPHFAVRRFRSNALRDCEL